VSVLIVNPLTDADVTPFAKTDGPSTAAIVVAVGPLLDASTTSLFSVTCSVYAPEWTSTVSPALAASMPA
jgi:hypothetical protein